MAKLRECPFCGGEAVVRRVGDMKQFFCVFLLCLWNDTSKELRSPFNDLGSKKSVEQEGK